VRPLALPVVRLKGPFHDDPPSPEISGFAGDGPPWRACPCPSTRIAYDSPSEGRPSTGRPPREPTTRKKWRRGWDSNPRTGRPVNGFRDRPIQPLWHLSEALLESGGEGGIRTHGRVSPTHAFQACSLSHSDTSPDTACKEPAHPTARRFCAATRRRSFAAELRSLPPGLPRSPPAGGSTADPGRDCPGSRSSPPSDRPRRRPGARSGC
jgi:hypothetical protein